MKRITIILSLKEKRAITEHAHSLDLCRCTFIHKAMSLYKKHFRKEINKRKKTYEQ